MFVVVKQLEMTFWKTHQLEIYSGDSISATELAVNTSQSQLFSSTSKGVLTFSVLSGENVFKIVSI